MDHGKKPKVKVVKKMPGGGMMKDKMMKQEQAQNAHVHVRG